MALATALMHPSRHGVLLDEPSLGQDPLHKEILVALLRALAHSGWLVLFSTHDLELAACADEMILLTEDGVVRHGAAPDILRDDEAWKQVGLRRPDWMDFTCSA